MCPVMGTDRYLAQVVWSELPFATFQLPECVGRVSVCFNCSKFVGPLRTQLRLSTQPPVPSPSFSSSPVAAMVTDLCSAPLPMLADEDQNDPILHCETCKTAFCSAKCSAASHAHSLLCPLLSTPQPNPWLDFQAFCYDKCETMAFAAYVVAVRAQLALLSSPAPPFAPFTQPLWWDIVPCPPGMSPDSPDAAAFRAGLQSDAMTGLEMLKSALAAHPSAPALLPIVEPMLTPEAWGRTLGLLSQNALAIEISSPVSAFLMEVRNALPHPAAIAATTALQPALHCLLASKLLRDALEEEDEEDEEEESKPKPPSEDLMRSCFIEASSVSGKQLLKAALGGVQHFSGSGLYQLLSCFNHSCDPNCSVHFLEDNRVFVVADKPIPAGEELTISYIDTEQELVDRQDDLATYAFTCTCARCEAERAAEMGGK